MMIATPLLVAGKFPIKYLVARQLPTHTAHMHIIIIIIPHSHTSNVINTT